MDLEQGGSWKTAQNGELASSHVPVGGTVSSPSDPFSFGVLSTFWKPGPVHSITLVPWFPGFRGGSATREGCSEPDLNVALIRGMAAGHTPCECLSEKYPLQSFLPRRRALYCRPVHPSPLVLALWDHVKWFWDRGEWGGQHVAQPRTSPNLSTARADACSAGGRFKAPVWDPSPGGF